jgi:hypothetical protein
MIGRIVPNHRLQGAASTIALSAPDQGSYEQKQTLAALFLMYPEK